MKGKDGRARRGGEKKTQKKENGNKSKRKGGITKGRGEHTEYMKQKTNPILRPSTLPQGTVRLCHNQGK